MAKKSSRLKRAMKKCACENPTEFGVLVLTEETHDGEIRDGVLCVGENGEHESTTIEKVWCKKCVRGYPIKRLSEHRWVKS